MRMTYLFAGVLVIGLIIVLGYVMRPAEVQNDSGILASTTPSMTETFSLSSPAFEQNGRIPSSYTCDGDRTLPPVLSFSGVPEGTRSLALIMDDPDVPKAVRPEGVFDHWVVFNMPPDTKGIGGKGAVPGTVGANGAGVSAYTGPCPPPQYEPSEHRYVFRLYALGAQLALPKGATKKEVLAAMEGQVLGVAELIGRYSRK